MHAGGIFLFFYPCQVVVIAICAHSSAGNNSKWFCLRQPQNRLGKQLNTVLAVVGLGPY